MVTRQRVARRGFLWTFVWSPSDQDASLELGSDDAAMKDLEITAVDPS